MTDFDQHLQHLIDHINDGSQAPLKYRNEHKQKIQTEVDQIRQAGVTSMDAFYALIGNKQAEIPLRRTAVSLLYPLTFRSPSKIIDRRRALPPLLRAVQSSDEDLCAGAVWALGTIQNKRALKTLLNIAENNPPGRIRDYAVHSLGMLDDPRAFTPLAAIAADPSRESQERIYAIHSLISYDQLPDLLLRIILDPTENLEVRCVAIEWHGIKNNEHAEIYIRLLQHEEAAIRFWAAYGWSQSFDDTYAANAMPILDRLIAFDHTPEPTMWHVSREAMCRFENIWYSRLAKTSEYTPYGFMYLVSPLLEFYDYQRKIYHWDEAQSQMISVPFEQTTTLDIDATWLTEQIRSQWPSAKFNVRQPQPVCLRLDWQIDMPQRILIGGLHRDGYLVMLMGDDEDASAFAVWLRGIIAAEHILRFYDWAGFGITIHANMTPAQLVELSDNAYNYDDLTSVANS